MKFNKMFLIGDLESRLSNVWLGSIGQFDQFGKINNFDEVMSKVNEVLDNVSKNPTEVEIFSAIKEVSKIKLDIPWVDSYYASTCEYRNYIGEHISFYFEDNTTFENQFIEETLTAEYLNVLLVEDEVFESVNTLYNIFSCTSFILMFEPNTVDRYSWKLYKNSTNLSDIYKYGKSSNTFAECVNSVYSFLNLNN